MDKDIDTMNDRELLVELADRVIDWERKLESIDAWSYAERDDVDFGLVIDEDEAFCRVREIIRKVKDDKYIWQC